MAIQFSQAVELVKEAIRSLDDESLRLFYEQYVARFLSDNDRIWLTGSIMIPLALSAFALLPTIQNPTSWQLLPIAVVSVTVLLVWNSIADHHRQFQDKSMAWIVAIEQLLIERGGQHHPGFVKIGHSILSVRAWRWSLLIVVALVWLFVVFTWPTSDRVR